MTVFFHEEYFKVINAYEFNYHYYNQEEDEQIHVKVPIKFVNISYIFSLIYQEIDVSNYLQYLENQKRSDPCFIWEAKAALGPIPRLFVF